MGTISKNAVVLQSSAGKQIPEPIAFDGDGTDVKLKLLGIKACLWDPGFAHQAAATVNPKADKRDRAVSQPHFERQVRNVRHNRRASNHSTQHVSIWLILHRYCVALVLRETDRNRLIMDLEIRHIAELL